LAFTDTAAHARVVAEAAGRRVGRPAHLADKIEYARLLKAQGTERRHVAHMSAT
jgi:hypothetical protein